jgi:hypothetical protein
MARTSMNTSQYVILKPVLQGLLRVFGGSPRTLFARAFPVRANITREYRYEYIDIDPNHGVLLFITKGAPWTPMAAEAWAGMCEAVFDFCGTVGHAVVESLEQEGAESILRIRCDWA